MLTAPVHSKPIKFEQAVAETEFEYEMNQATAILAKWMLVENTNEMLTTGLTLLLDIACSQPEMDENIITHKLGKHYEEFISLGHEFTNFNKNKFIHDNKALIAELQASSIMIEILEQKE